MAEQRRLDIILGTKDRTGKALQKATRKFTELGSHVVGVAGRMSAALSAVAVGVFTGGSIRKFASFEKNMQRVLALTGATNEEMERLEQTALTLGATTEFTSTQAADAMNFFALAGLKINEIISSMRPTLNLASAGQVELGRAADILVGIMKSMEIEATDLTPVIDGMTQAMTTSNVTIEDLAEGMAKIGPLANIAGKELTEVFAALQIMIDAGIPASSAGRSFRNLIIRLVQDTGPAAEKLKELGINAETMGGQLKHTADFIDDLKRSMEGLAPVQQLSNLATIAGAENIAALSAIINRGTGDFREFEQAQKEAAGRTQEITDIQLKGIAGEITRLSSAFDGLQTAVGKEFAPGITKGLKELTMILGNTETSLASMGIKYNLTLNGMKIALREFWDDVKNVGKDLIELPLNLLKVNRNFAGILQEVFKNFNLETMASRLAKGESIFQFPDIDDALDHFVSGIDTYRKPKGVDESERLKELRVEREFLEARMAELSNLPGLPRTDPKTGKPIDKPFVPPPFLTPEAEEKKRKEEMQKIVDAQFAKFRADMDVIRNAQSKPFNPNLNNPLLIGGQTIGSLFDTAEQIAGPPGTTHWFPSAGGMAETQGFIKGIGKAVGDAIRKDIETVRKDIVAAIETASRDTAVIRTDGIIEGAE